MSASGTLPTRPILVTGGSGQVGFELRASLSGFGSVVTPTRSELDLDNPDSIRDYVRSVCPVAIVNPAAYTAVDRAEMEAEAATSVNAEAPRVLAEEAQRLGAPIVHFSTDYVFDGSKTGAYTENDATNPLGVYGRTKLAGESAVADNSEAWLVLRCSWVYSRRGTNFLRTMLRLGAEREALDVVDDQFGSPTWARDIARATAQIFESGRASGTSLYDFLAERRGIYHLSAAGKTTWCGFARAIFDRVPGMNVDVRAIPTSAYKTAARRPANSVLDSSSIAATFGVRIGAWDDRLDICMSEQ